MCDRQLDKRRAYYVRIILISAPSFREKMKAEHKLVSHFFVAKCLNDNDVSVLNQKIFASEIFLAENTVRLDSAGISDQR